MSTGAEVVAKKKKKSRPSEGEGPRPIAIAVRARAEWKGWADRLREFASKKVGVTLSLNALVGLALSHYARSIGFKEDPPER